MADVLVGHLVHPDLRVHRHREDAVRTLAADAVRLERRSHREGHRLGSSRRVAQNCGGNVAGAARGDARHIVVVACPCIRRRAARHRRAEGHGSHLCTVADVLVGHLVHPDLRVDSNLECIGSPTALHSTIAKIRSYHYSSNHWSSTRIHCGELGNVALARCGKTDARSRVRPCITNLAALVRCHELLSFCILAMAYYLIERTSHLSLRVHRDGEVLRCSNAAHSLIGIGRGHRDRAHDRIGRCVRCPEGGDGVRRTVGSKSNSRVVVSPCVGDRACACGIRAKRNRRCVAAGAYHLTGDICHNNRRVHRHTDGAGRTVN